MGVGVRNGEKMDKLLVKGKDYILMLIQALDPGAKQPCKQWLWSQEVCSESSPSQKACQTRRLELPRGRDPWKGEFSPY